MSGRAVLCSQRAYKTKKLNVIEVFAPAGLDLEKRYGNPELKFSTARAPFL
jgi:hypothetical protein